MRCLRSCYVPRGSKTQPHPRWDTTMSLAVLDQHWLYLLADSVLLGSELGSEQLLRTY